MTFPTQPITLIHKLLKRGRNLLQREDKIKNRKKKKKKKAVKSRVLVASVKELNTHPEVMGNLQLQFNQQSFQCENIAKPYVEDES